MLRRGPSWKQVGSGTGLHLEPWWQRPAGLLGISGHLTDGDTESWGRGAQTHRSSPAGDPGTPLLTDAWPAPLSNLGTLAMLADAPDAWGSPACKRLAAAVRPALPGPQGCLRGLPLLWTGRRVLECTVPMSPGAQTGAWGHGGWQGWPKSKPSPTTLTPPGCVLVLGASSPQVSDPVGATHGVPANHS